MNDTRTLPAPIWVATPSGFRAMLDRLTGQPALAIDTEANSLYAYRERTCLIQISIPPVDFLVDPLALPELDGLGPLLADPQVVKVLHGGEYDLSVLHRDFGFVVDNLFDTMWASRILGWPAHGLADLLQAHFGVTLNKKYQRANWGVRPLPPEQLDYARLDSHYLLALRSIQAQELEAHGRWPQASHRFAALARTRWEHKEFDPDGFWRITGVRDLDDTGRGVLRRLFRLRDDCARAEDLPPFKVLSNQLLLALSSDPPEGLDDLHRVKGMPRWVVGRYGRDLVAAVGQGKSQPLAGDQRPRAVNGPDRREGGRPTAACQARFEALRTWRNSAAQARGVEPDIILNNQTLWAVAQRHPRRRADLERDGLLAAWQVEDFGEELLAVLS